MKINYLWNFVTPKTLLPLHGNIYIIVMDQSITIATEMYRHGGIFSI